MRKYFEEKVQTLDLADYFKPLKIETSKANISFKIHTNATRLNTSINLSGSALSISKNNPYTKPTKFSDIFEKIKSAFKNKVITKFLFKTNSEVILFFQ